MGLCPRLLLPLLMFPGAPYGWGTPLQVSAMSCSVSLLPLSWHNGEMTQRGKPRGERTKCRGAGSQEVFLVPTLKLAFCRNKPSLGFRAFICKVRAVSTPGPYQKSQRMKELTELGFGEKVKRINSRDKSPWPDLLVLALGKVTHSGPPRIAHYSWLTTPVFSPDLLGKRISGKS